MTCHLCSKVAFYMVPVRTEQRFYCADHRVEAVNMARRNVREFDRPHHPEVIGGFTFHQRIWR